MLAANKKDFFFLILIVYFDVIFTTQVKWRKIQNIIDENQIPNVKGELQPKQECSELKLTPKKVTKYQLGLACTFVCWPLQPVRCNTFHIKNQVQLGFKPFLAIWHPEINSPDFGGSGPIRISPGKNRSIHKKRALKEEKLEHAGT